LKVLAFVLRKNKNTMRKIILIYGLIAGAIVSTLMFITMPMMKQGHITFDNGEIVGYTTMVISLSMVFFGIKSYRDNYQDGTITFGRAFKVGILITLIAAVMYALAWEVCYHTIMSDFMERMRDHYFTQMKEKGMSAEAIQKEQEQWATFTEYYKNPVIRFAMTLVEILPVGLAITLISAGLLRKREFLSVKDIA
jgi:hypothetical protein